MRNDAMLSRQELCSLTYASLRALALAAVPPDVLALAESWGTQMSSAAQRGESSVTIDVTQLTRDEPNRLAQAMKLMLDYSPNVVRDFNGQWQLTLVWAGTSVRVREGKV